MSLTRRLRFEVLRRDGHACRYCGAAAPDAQLTVDHVLPVALGGADEAENLVTACTDCNSGKSSSAPDAPLVANVADDALRWAAAVRHAAEIQAARRTDDKTAIKAFFDAWLAHYVPDAIFDGIAAVDLPDDWRASVQRLVDAGLEPAVISDAVRDTMITEHIPPERLFRYFCGICWRVYRERQGIARALYEAEQ